MSGEQRYCKNCGAELKKDSRFCGKCGTIVEQKPMETEKQQKFDEKEKKSVGKGFIAAAVVLCIVIGGLVGIRLAESKKAVQNSNVEITDIVVKEKATEETDVTEENEYVAVVKQGDDWFIINEQNKKIAKIPIDNISEVYWGDGDVLDGNRKYGLIEIFTEDNKVAFVDMQGNIVVEPVYESVKWEGGGDRNIRYGFGENGVCPIYENEKLGFINTKGEVICEPVFDSLQDMMPYLPLTYNLITYIKKDGKAGIIDVEGNTVVDFIYEEAYVDAENEIIYIKLEDKWGLMDIEGNIILEPVYEDLSHEYYWDDNLIEFELDGKYGLMNTQGKIILELIYDEFKNDEFDWRNKYNINRIKLNEKYGFVNTKGEIIVEPIYEDAGFLCNGFARVKSNGKWGYIDKNGTMILEPIYDNAFDFDEYGWATVQWEHGFDYINQYGEVMLDIPYSTVTPVQENGLIRFKENELYGVMNTKGEVVVPALYDNILDVSIGNSLWIVVEKDDKEGLVDTEGNVIVEHIYDNISLDSYSEVYGEEVAITIESGEKKGIVDSAGEVHLYDELGEFSKNGLARVKLDGKSGFVDKEGNMIVEPIWDDVFDFDNSGISGIAWVWNDNKYGLIDEKGNVIVEPSWEYAYGFHESETAIIGNNGKYGFINKEGEVFIEPQYDWLSPFGRKTERAE